jgi:hypothetical protein
MADDPARSTSFAKSLDPDKPEKSISSEFNRHAAGLQRELPLQGGKDGRTPENMVQKDRPAPALTPNGMSRQQPDREAYNARLEQERQRMLDRNKAAVERTKGSAEKDHDKEL